MFFFLNCIATVRLGWIQWRFDYTRTVSVCSHCCLYEWNSYSTRCNPVQLLYHILLAPRVKYLYHWHTILTCSVFLYVVVSPFFYEEQWDWLIESAIKVSFIWHPTRLDSRSCELACAYPVSGRPFFFPLKWASSEWLPPKGTAKHSNGGITWPRLQAAGPE